MLKRRKLPLKFGAPPQIWGIGISSESVVGISLWATGDIPHDSEGYPTTFFWISLIASRDIPHGCQGGYPSLLKGVIMV